MEETVTDDRQERIRQRAFELWEQAGRPEGDHEKHWHQAVREIEAEDGFAQHEEATIAERAPSDLLPG